MADLTDTKAAEATDSSCDAVRSRYAAAATSARKPE